ncbi:accessory gland protein Acp29AB-like [Drosophila bipectinata]|uniref:accessory gland protein Acp29AB-like n=1 Tax=Drosophila bipectinata TaxID=42026 RepID=UPI001C897B22|nr:accessory gland protein Acp29AB-like [Drosophila bipectinata]
MRNILILFLFGITWQNANLCPLEYSLKKYTEQVSSKLYWNNKPVDEIPSYTYEQIGSKYYYISEDKLYWGRALIMCRHRNGNLVSIGSKEEWNAITEKLNTSRNYWVDYYNLDSLSILQQFTSALTGKDAQFLKWTNETQSTYYRKRCVELQSEKDHLMHVVDCFHQKHYICEADEAQPPKKNFSTQLERSEYRLRNLELAWMIEERHFTINEWFNRYGGP